MLPEQWWTENGCIHIRNNDGTVDVLKTAWYRLEEEAARHKQWLQAEALRAHLTRKKELNKKDL